MKKVVMNIPVYVDENCKLLIDKFIAEGGIYDNINNGLLTEVLFAKALSLYFKSDVEFVGKNNNCGYDYYIPKLNVKIEHKTLSINKNTGSIKNLGDSKKIADYVTVFHPVTHKLMIISSEHSKKFLTNYDKTGNKYHVDLFSNYDNIHITKRKNTKIYANTCLLLKEGIEIDLI